MRGRTVVFEDARRRQVGQIDSEDVANHYHGDGEVPQDCGVDDVEIQLVAAGPEEVPAVPEGV